MESGALAAAAHADGDLVAAERFAWRRPSLEGSGYRAPPNVLPATVRRSIHLLTVESLRVLSHGGYRNGLSRVSPTAREHPRLLEAILPATDSAGVQRPRGLHRRVVGVRRRDPRVRVPPDVHIRSAASRSDDAPDGTPRRQRRRR